MPHEHHLRHQTFGGNELAAVLADIETDRLEDKEARKALAIKKDEEKREKAAAKKAKAKDNERKGRLECEKLMAVVAEKGWSTWQS